jgi:hypothetical protein
MENAQNLTQDIEALIDGLNELKTLIAEGRAMELQTLLDGFAAFRRKLPEKPGVRIKGKG